MNQFTPKPAPITPEDVGELKRILAHLSPPEVDVHHDPDDNQGAETLRFNVKGAELVLYPTAQGRWSWDIDPHEGRQQGSHNEPRGGGGGEEGSIADAVARALEYAGDPRP